MKILLAALLAVSPMMPYDFAGLSGPHKIYRTYADPIQSHWAVYPINVQACLEKVCVQYAREQYNADTIIARMYSGILGQGWTYDPGDWFNRDPIDLYRHRRGQCADFAMYMTALLHTRGIPANCRTIMSGDETLRRLQKWINRTYRPALWFLLWTVPNVGGPLSDGAYAFSYHMATHFTSGTSHLMFDPIFPADTTWRTWVRKEFRYYYNLRCDDIEPPSADPGIYDWASNTVPDNWPTPNWRYYTRNWTHCVHPPWPLVATSIGHGPPASQVIPAVDSSMITGNLQLRKLGLDELLPSTAQVITFDYFNRTEEGGHYFERPAPTWKYGSPTPATAESVAVDSADIAFIKSVVDPFLKEAYFDDAIFEYTQNYYLNKFDRREFFAFVESHGLKLKIAGWYGKFTHIIVYADYDSKQGFVDAARRYLNLPFLDTSKVAYEEEILDGKVRDYFYEYQGESAEWKLVGYPNIQWQEEKEVFAADILDLTIYAK